VNNVLDAGTIAGADVVAVGGNTSLRVTLPAAAVLDSSAAIAFDLAVAGIEDDNGVDAVTLSATMAPVDVLAATLALGRNFIPNDGRLVAGDQLLVTWSCQMDEFETLSSVQEAVDALMGDGIGSTTTANNITYVVEVLPGRVFEAPLQETLTIANVATDLDIVVEGGDANNDGDGRVSIAGPFALTFDDLAIEDVTLDFVIGSADGFTAVFAADAPLVTGTWFLSTVTNGLTRGELELPVVFTDALGE
jgi:hypothetical protein